MKRALLILLAAASVASAQTFLTVTADTNRVIRTNFSLVRSQVSDLSGATFAISNITALQTTLDGKLATNGSAAGLSNFPASLLTTNGSAAGLTSFPASLLTTNGNAAGLTNFPSLLLRTNGDAVALTNFPTSLLRTNGDGSGLTNLPNANLSNAVGILPVANGGSGATNQAGARTAFGLGTAATNDASAFQPASSALTNLASGDGSALTNLVATNGSAAGLTNFPAELLRTNGDAAALTNFPSLLLRTNGDGGGLTNVSVDLTAVLPSYSNNALKVLSVSSGETNVEWIAVSNTVTDASTLTNFPAYVLQTNGSAAGLTNFPSELLRTNGDAVALTNFPALLLRTNGSAAGLTGFPTLNQNTTGTASNVTGVVAVANGGSGASTASNARVNLLPSYSGNALRVLALDSNANDVVWAVDGGGQANLTNVTGTLAVLNGGTGAIQGIGALVNLGVLSSSSSSSATVTIGGGTSVTGTTAVAIGVNADANSTNGLAVGGNCSTSGGTGAIALGNNSIASADRSIALGYLASATASNSVQIAAINSGGSRTSNNVANSIQFLDAGSVTTNSWNALANSSTQGRYAMTNTAGISGSKTFVAYDGTNYSTNTVTFSNGIITGWTP